MLKILSSAVLGIEDATLPPQGGVSTMYLGPNPAFASTTLNWLGTGEKDLEVSVFDLSGRVVLERTLPAGVRTLDLTGFPAGTYIVDAAAPGNIRQSARLVILGN